MLQSTQIKEWESQLEKEYTFAGSMTVSEMCSEVWLQVIAGKSLNTVRGYEINIKRVHAGLGSARLSQLTPRKIQKWIDQLAASLAPKTVKASYSILRCCCTVATNWELLERNPCHDIILPTKKREEVRILSEDEFKVFCDHLTGLDPDTRVLIELALFCSLRRGEINGYLG